MKRILFVDDEPQILQALGNLLRKQRRTWEMVFASGGQAALEEMAKAPVDVIVSDMRMPEMDGATLLQKAKALYPSTARIVLSGQADRDLIVRVLPVSHQYLSKPCDGATLRRAIERACEIHALLENPSLRGEIGRIDHLPSTPEAYSQLRRSLARHDSCAEDVSRIVERDPAMTAKILQMVSSSYFGQPPAAVSSIRTAVSHIGLDVLGQLAKGHGTFSAAANLLLTTDPEACASLRQLCDEAHAVGCEAQSMSDSVDAESGEAFAAGLLHDVGKLVLAMAMPDRYADVLRRAHDSGRPLYEVEKELLGATHAEAGAYLLALWGLPVPVVEAIAAHHAEPSPTHGMLTATVQRAITHVHSLAPESA
jgi:HD-like signal output (HDOD) protein/ActR/RegA family two-component response regulator